MGLRIGLRIVGGSAGGRIIAAPRGDSTRPTSDRVREAIFNILASRSGPPAAALDLFAGSGAMGLEAISRGAGRAVFVERHKPTAALIGKNAAALGFSAVETIARPVLDALAALNQSQFGWVFADPPYADGALPATLDALQGLPAGALVVAEHASRDTLADRYGRLALCDRRRYGDASVSIYECEP
jgi:16S rRNA (guanine(966)-N(2))-methyltransferase RsmD